MSNYTLYISIDSTIVLILTTFTFLTKEGGMLRISEITPIIRLEFTIFSYERLLISTFKGIVPIEGNSGDSVKLRPD